MPLPGSNHWRHLGNGVDPRMLGATIMAKSTLPVSIDIPRATAVPVATAVPGAAPTNTPAHPAAAATHSALLQLPDHERDILLLRVFHGQSCAAIARRLGQTEADIRQRQLDALKHLRQLLQQDTAAAS